MSRVDLRTLYMLLVTLSVVCSQEGSITMHTRTPDNKLKSITKVTWREETGAHLYCWSKRQTTYAITFTCEHCSEQVKKAISKSTSPLRLSGAFIYAVLNRTTIDEEWHGITIVCRAKEQHDSRVVEANATVHVIYFSAPLITQDEQKPADGVLYTEGEARLRCEAHGNPKIDSYTWKEGNKTLSYRDQLVVNVEVLGANRTLTCIARSCNGEEKATQVSVRRYAPPRNVENTFSPEGREVTQRKNSSENVSISCETKSHPEPMISWYFIDPDGRETKAECSISERREKVGRLTKVSSSCVVEINSYEKSGYYSCQACLSDANAPIRNLCFPENRTSKNQEIVVKGLPELIKKEDNGTHINIEFNANPMRHAMLEYWIDGIRKEEHYEQHPKRVAYKYKILIENATNVSNLRFAATGGDNETIQFEMRKAEESAATFWIAIVLCVLLLVALVLFCFIAHKGCFARKKKYVTGGRLATLPQPHQQTTTMYI